MNNETSLHHDNTTITSAQENLLEQAFDNHASTTTNDFGADQPESLTTVNPQQPSHTEAMPTVGDLDLEARSSLRRLTRDSE